MMEWGSAFGVTFDFCFPYLLHSRENASKYSNVDVDKTPAVVVSGWEKSKLLFLL